MAQHERLTTVDDTSATSGGKGTRSSNAPRQRPNIRDVARQAGVSAATVSNFLNRKGRMSGETRTRIEEAITALHFTPSALMRAIRDGRTHILGVFTFGLGFLDEEGLAGPAPALLAGMADGAEAAGSDLLLFTGWTRRAEREVGLRLLDGNIDGLLWVLPQRDEPHLAKCVAAGLPVMAVLTREVPDAVGYVCADNRGAMGQVVSHLADRGHRRIAYAGPTFYSDFVDRRDGARDALEIQGLFDPALFVAVDAGHPDPQVCADILASLLRLPAPPTALMCATDLYAAAFARVAAERGVRIPDDLALTGFDDSPISPHVAGGLTTIRQPFRKMGNLAVTTLLAMIAGTGDGTNHHTLATELVIRSSTAQT